jgi:uncharacterized protein HemY
LRKAIETKPNDPWAYDQLGWLLATCPEPSLRDPVQSVTSAKKATDLAPREADYWSTLGVAHYRAGDWKAALEALQKSIDLSKGGVVEWLVLAMCHWKMGKQADARLWYLKAVLWMDTHKGNVIWGHTLFRAEAAELLGMSKEKIQESGARNQESDKKPN